MEHLWRGHRLIVASYLETTVDDLLDDLTADGAAWPRQAGDDRCGRHGGAPLVAASSCRGIEAVPRLRYPLVDEAPAPVSKSRAHHDATTSRTGPPSRAYILSHQLAGRVAALRRMWRHALGTAVAHHGGPPPALPHAWDGTTLVVRERGPASVEAMMAGVESRRRSVARSRARQARLRRRRHERREPHRAAPGPGQRPRSSRAERRRRAIRARGRRGAVERLLDGIDFPDALPAQQSADLADPDDGLVAQRVLSDLFEACDRLVHDAHNADAILALVKGADRIEELAVPFGFDRTGMGSVLIDEWSRPFESCSKPTVSSTIDGATEQADEPCARPCARWCRCSAPRGAGVLPLSGHRSHASGRARRQHPAVRSGPGLRRHPARLCGGRRRQEGRRRRHRRADPALPRTRGGTAGAPTPTPVPVPGRPGRAPSLPGAARP